MQNLIHVERAPRTFFAAVDIHDGRMVNHKEIVATSKEAATEQAESWNGFYKRENINSRAIVAMVTMTIEPEYVELQPEETTPLTPFITVENY